MAKVVGISVSSVQRIWRAHGLQPHRLRQFKLSNDPNFAAKLRDVVGLYIDPPAHAAHKHPKVIEWLGRHPRVTFHFTPTLASWLNAVEGFFAKLGKPRLRRGVFHSLVSLQAAINRYVAQANDAPPPFRWTKDPDKIIAAVRRGHQVLDSPDEAIPPSPSNV
jgi:transposase